MENIILDFMGKACTAMLSKMGNTHLKLICTKGIDIVVAETLEGPSSLLFKDVSTPFAGDDLTQAEASEDLSPSMASQCR